MKYTVQIGTDVPEKIDAISPSLAAEYAAKKRGLQPEDGPVTVIVATSDKLKRWTFTVSAENLGVVYSATPAKRF